MTDEEKREQVIEGIANLLRTMPFSLEYKVKKKPAGIKVICEMTKEEVGVFMEEFKKKKQEGHGARDVEAVGEGGQGCHGVDEVALCA